MKCNQYLTYCMFVNVNVIQGFYIISTAYYFSTILMSADLNLFNYVFNLILDFTIKSKNYNFSCEKI